MKLFKFTELACVIILVSFLTRPGLSQHNYNEKGSKYPELKHIFSLTTTNFQAKINLDAYRYRPQQLPFFCRMEHKIEQKSNIPFRFRIGDLNYVNALENKTNTYIFAH